MTFVLEGLTTNPFMRKEFVMEIISATTVPSILLFSRLIDLQDVVLRGLVRRIPYLFHCQCGRLLYRRHTEAESRSSIAGIGRLATKKEI